MVSRNFVGLAFVLVAALAPLATQALWANATGDAREYCSGSPGQRFHRTELFFGLSKPDGSTTTDAEFQRFVDTEVVPRFPDGFTVVAGNGQFKDARGVAVRERARVIVVVHPPDDGRASASLESIRGAYKAEFRQESVLRVDGISCASF